MAREVAHGEIVIGVDLDKVGAELRHAEMQFQRAMANIDRMKAEAKAGVDSTKLDRQVAEAKRRLLELDKMSPKAKADLGTKQFDAEYAKLKAKLRDLNQEKIEMRVETKELRDANRLSRIAAQNQQLMAKRSLELAKAEERKQKTWRDGAAMQQRAIDLDRKRAIEIEKLRVQYIKLHDEVEKGQKLALFDFLGDETARRKFSKTSAELASVGARLKELGDSDRDLHRLGRASDSAGTRLRNMLTSVGSIRIQMGFLSATLRQTAIGFTALGPVVFGLLGQIVSLVGVLGTGLTGALAVTSAGLAGFGLTALGIGLIMKPLIGDLQDAMKASKAYDDAVRKYGRGSDQAASAQEKLNKTLGDVGPQTRKAFESLGSLSSRWSNMTRSSRPVFFEAMASGIQALNRLLPMFARESNSAFSTAGKEAKKWFSLLSSDAANRGIQAIMSNFTEAFPALSGGFRSLTVMMGRVSASASRLLPELTNGFRNWARNLTDTVGTGDALDQKIERLVEHMRQVGRFAQSAGSMLAAFFNAGANEGATLLNTLTSIFDRWTDWMNTASGQASLASFFSEANSIGSQFVGTLASIGVALFEFSAAFAPLSQGFLSVINGVTSLVAAFMGLSAARGIVTTLGGALAGAFVASKLMAAASAIGAIVTAVRTLGAAGTVASLASLTNPIIALAAVVGGAVAAFSLLSGASQEVTSSLGATAPAARAVEDAIASMAGQDVNAARAGLELQAATAAKRKAQEGYNAAVDKFGASSPQARKAEEMLTDATLRRQSAVLSMKDASKQAFDNYTSGADKANKAMDKAASNIATYEARIEGWRRDVEKADLGHLWGQSVAKNRSLIQQVAAQGDDYMETLKGISTEEKQLAKQRAILERLNNRQALSDLNLTRAAKGAAPVLDGVGKAWRGIRTELSYLDGGMKVAKAFETMKGSPQQMASLIKLTDSLRGFDKLSQAGKIIVNSKSIDEALAKLKRLNKTTSTLVEAKVKKGTAERDLANLGKGKTATIQTKADTKNADKQLKGLSGKQIVSRLNIRADNKDAMSKLNAVQSRKLQAKPVKIDASPQAAMAAIALINGKKIPEKIAKFKAQADEAESANKKVQGFKDKTTTVRTKADLSGALAAKSAVEAVPSSKTSTITTVHKTVGSPGGRAAGGPAAGAYNYGPLPAEERRNAQSAGRASVRQNRPGIYRRPTLLVGEENQDEFVIATNPSYRAVNERYLEEAASRFGYKLSRFDDMAAKGKAPKKKAPSKALPKKRYKKMTAAQRQPNKTPSADTLAKTRTRYDYLRDKISFFETSGSNERSRQDNLITAGTLSEYDKPGLMRPYQNALGVYPELRKTMENMLRSMRGRLTTQMGIDRGISKKDLKTLQQRVIALKRNTPKKKKDKSGKITNDKEIRKHEREIKKAEQQLADAKERDRNARGRIPSIKDEIANLKRELMFEVPNEEDALRNTIESIRLGERDSGGGAGGSSTPMGLQLASLDQQRYDLFRQFGSNIMPPGGGAPGVIPHGPGGSAPPGIGGPSFYQSGAAAGVLPAGLGRSGGAASAPFGSGGSGTVVNQNITIAEPPPDPHSFARALGWEAGVA